MVSSVDPVVHLGSTPGSLWHTGNKTFSMHQSCSGGEGDVEARPF